MTETTRTEPPKKNLTIDDLKKAKRILEHYGTDDTPFILQPEDTILDAIGDRPDSFVNHDALRADMTVKRLTALDPPLFRCHPTDHDYVLSMVRSWEIDGIAFRIQTNPVIPEGKAWMNIGQDQAILFHLATGEGFQFKRPKFTINEKGLIRASF